MSNNSKTFLAFAIGAAIGVAITALLTTDKGKEIIDKTKGSADDMLEKIKSKISDLQNEMTDKSNPDTNTQV